MYTSDRKPDRRILVVRLGAMGDIIHALPAVANLKSSFPNSRVTWVVAPQWAPLLEGNPFVDRIILFERGSVANLLHSHRELTREAFDFAVDFQGLIKSALIAKAARPDRIFGFDDSREEQAGVFYSNRVTTSSAHVVDRNLELTRAAGADASPSVFPLPAGKPEQPLPTEDFILACPLAGWTSKQWPLASYAELSKRLPIPLVVNGPPSSEETLRKIDGAIPNLTGLPGLIYATRRAAAVVGVDSGPLHIAAALGKPGVAIFGPTDPERNGPYGGSLQVLRSPRALTSYKRRSEIDESMREITPGAVALALEAQLRSV